MFRRSHPVPVVAVVAVLELGVTLLHPWGSNVSAGLWFALYAVAVARSRRFALGVPGRGHCAAGVRCTSCWQSARWMAGCRTWA